MGCTIDLEQISIQDEPYIILYSSDSQSVYKENNKIVLSTRESNVLDVAPAPLSYRFFEHAETSKHHIFLFSGQHFVVLDKRGSDKPNKIKTLDPILVGRSATKIYSVSDDCIIFAVSSRGQSHLIKYNPVSEKKIVQTASYKLDQCNDLLVLNQMAYLLLDNSFIIMADMLTGEVIQTRFESSNIPSQLSIYGNELLYFTNNILHRIGKDSKKEKIPSLKVHRVEGVVGSNLILSVQEGKELCSYDLKKKKIQWRVKSQDIVLETIIVQGLRKKKTIPVLIARMKSSVCLVNLDDGTILKNIFMDQVYRIRETSNHVLLHRNNDITGIIRGIYVE